MSNNYFTQESSRLIYRKLTTDDISSWLEFFTNNNKLHYLGMDLSKSVDELAKEWISAQLRRYETQGLGHLAVEIKGSHELIGMCGIIPREIEGRVEYEIAYSLKPAYWQKGYGTEMAKQMKQYGLLLQVNRFISIIHKDNKDSMHVARKNNMKVLFETEYQGMDVLVFGIENNW